MTKPPGYYVKASQFLGWAKNSPLDKERLLLLKEYSKGRKILDIGCGYGLYVDHLSKNGFDGYGVDFTADFIASAKKSKKGTFIMADAGNLPFSDNEFDTTLLFDILEHGDDKKILKEAKRVTRTRILVIVPRIADNMLEQSGVIFRHYLDKSHLREYEKEHLEKLAKFAELKITLIQNIHLLYNEAIFLSLFQGPMIFKKIIRKIVFFLLPKKIYPTEIFCVLEK